MWVNKNKLFFLSLLLLSCSASSQAALFSNKCSSTNGTLRIVEPEDVSAWTSIGLSAPTKILKVFVNDSKCFTIVDRGSAFNAAQLERSLASSGMLQSGQNIGAGQMKAADFVMVPDLISQNLDAGGSNLNVSGSKAGVWGVGSGKASRTTRKKSAEVVLTLIDVRTSEQVASVTAKAVIKDSMNAVQLGANVPVSMVNGQVGFSNYSNTPIGTAIRLAYEEAYDLLMNDIKKKNLGLRRYNVPQAVEYQNVQQTQPIASQQVSYQQVNSFQAADTQQVHYQQHQTDVVNTQVQNVYVNQQVQQNSYEEPDMFSNQAMMQQVEQNQAQVQQMQRQAQSMTPVSMGVNSLTMLGQSVANAPVNVSASNNVQPQAQVNQQFANIGANSQGLSQNIDPVLDFLTRFKSVDEDARQQMIANLANISPSTLKILRKPGLNKDKLLLMMLSNLPNVNQRQSDAIVKTLSSLSDNQLNNLISTYRYMLDNN